MYARGKGKKKHNNKAVKDVSDSDKYADLLVFGYACKVFRDDERALFHEHGKHLIPWMGEKKITIDRYDGRGHVHDLSEYDSGSWNTSYQLSEEEARIEALCDEERYLAMHTDLLEEEARQEEEYKRLSEALADEGTYTAVGFKYTADYYDPSQPTEEEEANREAEEAEQDEDEEPFVAPAGLTIPPDVELPATSKTHAIIERTANFVSQQGAQFEIVLKAKQSGNSQFDFLRFDHYLNPYYRHILRAMKEGRYTATADKPEPDPDSSDDSDADGDGSYLHPSLFAPKKNARLAEIMKPLQVMDPDHPLAALVRRAKLESNGGYAIAATPSEVLEPPPASTPPPAQYSADPTMYYGYYMLPDGTYCLAPPPPPGIDASTYYANTPPGTTAPPTGAEDLLPPGTALPPASDPGPAAYTISAPPVLIKNPTLGPAPAPIPAPTPGPTLGPVPAAVVAPPTLVPEVSTRPPPVSRAATTPVPATAVIIPPPPDIQPVIDKLAEYVARNGVKFETSVRAKNDPRFDFLQTWNQFNTYYEFKKNYFMQKEGISLAESESAETAEDNEAKEAIVTKAAFAPICFAIRAKDNDMLPLEKNRVRLDDDSDEDKLLEEQCAAVLMARPDLADKEVAGPGATLEEKRPALTPEELEAKQAKLKLEDRLAAAAREKLAQASKESKEKQLQAERKRKAALFLQTLRAPGSGEPEAKRVQLNPVTPRQVKPQLSVAACPPPAPTSSSSSSSVAPAYLQDQRAPVEHQGAHRSREGTTTTTAATSSSAHSHSHSRSHATSRGAEPERSKGRDKDKKKKKHKKRSRSRSKTRHALPSAYRRTRRSRSRSPGRRDRRAPSAERRHEEREREREHHHHHHHHHQHRRGPAKSRSPPEKRKSSLRSSGAVPQSASSAFSPSFSPPAAHSPSASPASSLGQSRAASQEKESAVSASIVSSVQAKITQDLMAKVRAMLAASKTFQPTT